MDRTRAGRSFIPSLSKSEEVGSESVARPTVNIPFIPPSPSPARSEGGRHFSVMSNRHTIWRSFSSRDSTKFTKSRLPSTPTRRLSKSRHASSSLFELTSRRNSVSAYSDDYISRADTTSTASSSTIDWKAQVVEGATALEADIQLLRSRTPHLVVTTDLIIKLKSRVDALAMFPQLVRGPAGVAGVPGAPGARGGRDAVPDAVPEPLLVIQMSSLVAVFPAESNRPSFGLDVWWRSSSGTSFHHATFFYDSPGDRDEQLQQIAKAMRGSHQQGLDIARSHPYVQGPLQKMHEAEEPQYPHRPLHLFPVVPRGSTRKEWGRRPDDSTRKPQEESSHYFVVGVHMCHLVEMVRVKGGDCHCKHKTFGLVTLLCLRADWIPHQERFNITFRDPFGTAVTLELASRYYRDIIRVLEKADRYLKPTWPPLWQSLEIFRISALKEPQFLIPQEDYGSFKRTLDAYLSAYHSMPVEWEVNWKGRFAPEFRLLPAKNGGRHSPLQILAVLRALRYNNYFNSLCFRDVHLSVLWGIKDHSPLRPNVAYLNRKLLALSSEEVDVLKTSPLLHQEFHALAFCSEKVRQMDLTNAFSSLSSLESRRGERRDGHTALPSLTPLLILLQSGATRCSNLVLSGNLLEKADVEELVEALNKASIQGLDVSRCGLDDMKLGDLVAAVGRRPAALQSLDISSNPGRIPARLVPSLVSSLTDIRKLNLRGSLQGEMDGPLIPSGALERLECLQELDLSNNQLKMETVLELEKALVDRTWRMDEQKWPSKLERLLLNHCGLDGEQIARLFDAIGRNHGMHLYISGNPLERGISSLAQSIRGNRGPSRLHMDMVEFREEDNYLELIQAFTKTKYLTSLSLVGTVATPSLHGPCSPDVVSALADFYAHNRSIEFLDMSGYDGKLDDGQLAPGFGKSLLGLVKNTTLTHLRLRNQNLHDDAGALGMVVQENKSLLMFDCQDNNLNLTSLQFLVNSLRANKRIVEFSFPPDERENMFKNTLAGLRRQPQQVTATKTGAGKTKLLQEELMLRQVMQRKWDELDGYLGRNRRMLELATGQLLDLDSPSPAADADATADWPTLGLKAGEEERTRSDGQSSEPSTRPTRATVRSTAMLHASCPVPHYDYGSRDDDDDDDDDGPEKPSELEPGPAVMIAPEPVGPSTRQDLMYGNMFRKPVRSERLKE